MPRKISCHGCGGSVPDTSGPTHRYIGASPGCWAIYGEVLARSFGDFRRPPEHRLVVDTYAAQHPGSEGLQALRSVATHLIALHWVLERKLPLGRITELVRRHAKRPELRWLEPPADLGSMTVVDLRSAESSDDYARLCREWARSVWRAWSDHHKTIRSWAQIGAGVG